MQATHVLYYIICRQRMYCFILYAGNACIILYYMQATHVIYYIIYRQRMTPPIDLVHLDPTAPHHHSSHTHPIPLRPAPTQRPSYPTPPRAPPPPPAATDAPLADGGAARRDGRVVSLPVSVSFQRRPAPRRPRPVRPARARTRAHRHTCLPSFEQYRSGLCARFV